MIESDFQDAKKVCLLAPFAVDTHSGGHMEAYNGIINIVNRWTNEFVELVPELRDERKEIKKLMEDVIDSIMKQWTASVDVIEKNNRLKEFLLGNKGKKQ